MFQNLGTGKIFCLTATMCWLILMVESIYGQTAAKKVGGISGMLPMSLKRESRLIAFGLKTKLADYLEFQRKCLTCQGDSR